MGWVAEKLEQRNEALWAKLVPSVGPCDTAEGEMLRAINKIVYRRYNDGDYFYKGYGCETAGPAHAYLTQYSPLRSTLLPVLEEARWGDYEKNIEKALEIILDKIEACNGEYTPNTNDMNDCEAEYDSDDDYDDYDDEEEF